MLKCGYSNHAQSYQTAKDTIKGEEHIIFYDDGVFKVWQHIIILHLSPFHQRKQKIGMSYSTYLWNNQSYYISYLWWKKCAVLGFSNHIYRAGKPEPSLFDQMAD